MSRSSYVGIELLSDLFCSRHREGEDADGGDGAIVFDRKAKLQKTFIYAGGKAGNLFQETVLDSESNSVYSELMYGLVFPEESVAAARFY